MSLLSYLQLNFLVFILSMEEYLYNYSGLFKWHSRIYPQIPINFEK